MDLLAKIINRLRLFNKEQLEAVWRIISQIPVNITKMETLYPFKLFKRQPLDKRVLALSKKMWENPKNPNFQDNSFIGAFCEKEYGIGGDRIRNLFNKETGLTPLEAIKKMKLEYFRLSLIESNFSMIHLAEEAGLSLSHLSNDFKEEYEYTPKQYRLRFSQF